MVACLNYTLLTMKLLIVSSAAALDALQQQEACRLPCLKLVATVRCAE